MPGNPSFKKRQRERARQERRREKERKRQQRRNQRSPRAHTRDGEDPDIAGIRPGMQPWQLEAADPLEAVSADGEEDANLHEVDGPDPEDGV